MFKFTGEILSRVLTFVFYIYMARKLGVVDYGKYSFAYSFCSFFVVFFDLGLNTLFIRDVAASKEKIKKYLENITSIKLILSVLTFFLISLVIRLLKYPDYVIQLVQLMALVTIGTVFLDYTGAIFSSYEQMQYESILKIIIKFLISILGIYVLFIGYGLKQLIIVMFLCYVVTLIIGVYLIYTRITSFIIKFDFKFWKSTIFNSLPLALSGIFIVMYFRIDVILLSLIRGNSTEIGWYSAGMKIIDSIGVIPFLVMGGVFPVFSDLYKNNIDNLCKLYEKSFKYMCILGIGITFGGFLLSHQITDLLYGVQYKNTGIAFQILIVAVIFIFVDHLLLNILTAIEKQKLVALCTGICVPVNIGLNLILIPHYGYIGSAIAIVSTEIILFITTFYFVSKYLMKLQLFKIILKPLLSALFMVLILYLLINRYNIFILIIFGMVTYFVSLYILKTFSVEEYKEIGQLVKI